MTTEIKVKRHRQDFMDANGVVVPEETDTQILGLFGKYRPLSNFHRKSLTVDGIEYWTSEAAYMAEKTDVLEEKLNLSRIIDGTAAKKYGQTVTLKADWDDIKPTAMYKVLLAKFSQNPELAELLLSTGEKYIEETNWWGDKYWGMCGGDGLNVLGYTLMAVRNRLRDQQQGN
jgi:ribA/ribD-fused uncharacterized protein